MKLSTVAALLCAMVIVFATTIPSIVVCQSEEEMQQALDDAMAMLENKDHVITLTEENFEETIRSHVTVLVEFYAPWCGHCKKLAPEYSMAAKMLAKSNSKIVLAKVDATEQPELAKRFDIKGYPTMKIFQDHVLEAPEEYNGPRTAKGIVVYMNKRGQPDALPLHTKEQVLAYVEEDGSSRNYVVIGFFGEGEASSKHEKIFDDVARLMRNEFDFGKTSAEHLAEFNINAPHGIVAFKKYDERQVVFDGSDVTALMDFIKGHSLPLLAEINHENYEQYMAISNLAILILNDKESEKEKEKVRSIVLDVARENRGKLVFGQMTQEAGEHMLKSFGLEQTLKFSTLAVVRNKKSKYINNKAIKSTDKLSKWVAGVLGGKIKPILKTATPPALNNGPVKIVVASTFEEIVMDPKKDVLVEFYAPWCGHCKSLEPKYKKLAKSLADIPSVVIAKMDADQNDVPPEFDVQGFPTLYFVPAGSNKPIPYEGAREVQPLKNFVKKHSKVTWPKKSRKHK